MSLRTVRSVSAARPHRPGPRLVTYDISGNAIGDAIDPFIVVSFYEMAGPTFPPHPHAGFSVATYILPESPIGFVNQDTLGNRNRIPPGALHVTVDGAGVLHEEQPERDGPTARGFQIWIDHDNAEREIAPRALHLAPADVPVVRADGAQIRAVLGASNGAVSPLVAPTPVRVIDVALESGAAFAETPPPDENAFLFVLGGTIAIGAAFARAGDVVAFDRDGDTIAPRAEGGAARFTLFAGRPFGHRRAQSGPFVAADPAQLRRFMTRHRDGAFGTLTPFAQASDTGTV